MDYHGYSTVELDVRPLNTTQSLMTLKIQLQSAEPEPALFLAALLSLCSSIVGERLPRVLHHGPVQADE